MMMPAMRVKMEFTPLVNNILDQLPIDIWTSATTTFLDPAFGGGQFLRAIERRLREAGHSEENIGSRVYGCEVRQIRINWTWDHGRVKTRNLIKTDFLSYEGWGNMKFDVIVGNPPYQDTQENGERKSMSTNLWSKFIDKCAQDLLAENGWMSMIVPASWAGPTKNLSGNRRILKDILAQNNTTKISLDPDLAQYFNGVGSTFSYFVMQKAAPQGNTQIILDQQHAVTMNLADCESLPRINHPLAFEINKKWFSKIPNQDVIAGQYRVSDDQYQEKKTAKYKYPAYHTPADGGRTWYMKDVHPHMKDHKVMISLSGRYEPRADAGTQAYTDMCLAYILKPGEKLDSAFSVINSKLFHFMMAANKWSGFNNKQIIRRFPLPKLTKVYKDKDVFDWFQLTTDERQFVLDWYEAHIKSQRSNT